MKHFKRIIFFLITLCLYTCVEPIELKVEKKQDPLIIDGLITNMPGPYTVTLTRAAAFSPKLDGINVVEQKADVFIKDQLGFEVKLVETEPGKYITPINFKGQIGYSYALRVLTKEKKKYESKPELLKASSEIDSIYSEYKDGTDGKPEGFYVYIDTKGINNSVDYYRWQWAHYKLLRFCEGSRECCTSCWSIFPCNNCLTFGSEANLSNSGIKQKLIATIPYSSRSKYYLKIEQYSLSAEAYKYWKQINQISRNVGGTFDAPPSPVLGNIFCTTHPDEEVLGFFGASAVAVNGKAIRRDYVKKLPSGDMPDEPGGGGMGPPPPCKPCEESKTRTGIVPLNWE